MLLDDLSAVGSDIETTQESGADSWRLALKVGFPGMFFEHKHWSEVLRILIWQDIKIWLNLLFARLTSQLVDLFVFFRRILVAADWMHFVECMGQLCKINWRTSCFQHKYCLGVHAQVPCQSLMVYNLQVVQAGFDVPCTQPYASPLCSLCGCQWQHVPTSYFILLSWFPSSDEEIWWTSWHFNNMSVS